MTLQPGLYFDRSMHANEEFCSTVRGGGVVSECVLGHKKRFSGTGFVVVCLWSIVDLGGELIVGNEGQKKLPRMMPVGR